ncbi:MAG: arginine deiminase family protein [Candidatus Zixiibacteriota bacterium]
MKFTTAIVRLPGPSLVHGITTANLGVPDYQLALEQHHAYSLALNSCGLTVVTLPPDNDHPDSVFVEDTALLTPHGAILMRSGAPARREETNGMEQTIREFFHTVRRVEDPGTADGGDILMVEDHYYIGQSSRTNQAGAEQIIKILELFGLTGSTVPLEQGLHLKSDVAYLENSTMVVGGQFKSRAVFNPYKRIGVIDEESYAANCLWINDKVLIATGHPNLEKALGLAGFETIALDMSEFRKLDGGLSCLSLRF